MLTGTVKFFVNQPNKMFGFLEGDIFFHYLRGGIFINDGDEVPALERRRDDLRKPEKGSELVYEADDGEKGPRVVWWGFLDNWLEVTKEIENRPIYRLTVWEGDRETAEVVWQGKNLSEVNAKYKHLYHSDTRGFFFEKWNGEAWEQCEDVRDCAG